MYIVQYVWLYLGFLAKNLECSARKILIIICSIAVRLRQRKRKFRTLGRFENLWDIWVLCNEEITRCEYEGFASIPTKICRGWLSPFWPSVPTALKVVQKSFKSEGVIFCSSFYPTFRNHNFSFLTTGNDRIILYIIVTFLSHSFLKRFLNLAGNSFTHWENQ